MTSRNIDLRIDGCTDLNRRKMGSSYRLAIMLKIWAYCTLVMLASSGTVAGEVVIELSAADSPNGDLFSSAEEGYPVASQPEDSAIALSTAIVPNPATNSGGNRVPSLIFLGMSKPWISIASVALFFTSTTVVAIFLFSRAPVIELDDPRRYRVDGPRPTRLGHESESKRHRSGRPRKARRKAREGAGAVVANLDFTPHDQPETIADVAHQLVSSLTDAEHDLLRDASGDILSVGIKIGIRQNWQVCNPNSSVFLDAVDNYEAYDADAVCHVIIEAAQELLSDSETTKRTEW